MSKSQFRLWINFLCTQVSVFLYVRQSAFWHFFLTNFHRNCACVLCAMCIYAVVPKGQLSCCMLYVCVCVDYSDTYVTWSVGVVRWQHASLLYQWTPYVVGGTHIYYKHQYTPSAVFIYSRRKRKLQIIGEEQVDWNRCIYDIWIFLYFTLFGQNNWIPVEWHMYVATPNTQWKRNFPICSRSVMFQHINSYASSVTLLPISNEYDMNICITTKWWRNARTF